MKLEIAVSFDTETQDVGVKFDTDQLKNPMLAKHILLMAADWFDIQAKLGQAAVAQRRQMEAMQNAQIAQRVIAGK